MDNSHAGHGTRLGPGLAALAFALASAAAAAHDAPARLADTGLYREGTLEVAPGNLPFSPQYPLWSDGTLKRRWIHLPPGTFIDARDPLAWEFPRGTRLWKEFGYGRPVETRYIERRADGSWRFAAYVWNEAGTGAVLAPARGLPAHATTAAPGGRYAVPGEADCRACHEGGGAPVLGFALLQLSPDRDPLAPHATRPAPDELDLAALAARGLVRNLPAALLAQPPRIPAADPVTRAALGYLHGNCGHCHNRNEAAPPVRVRLAQTGRGDAVADAWRTLTAASRFHGGLPGAAVLAPGDAAGSVLVARMRSRDPRVQMPPLGTRVADRDGLALIERWIDSLPSTPETSP
jgi:hypothetical protein